MAPLRGKKTEFKEELIGKEKLIEIIKVELIRGDQKDKNRTKREES